LRIDRTARLYPRHVKPQIDAALRDTPVVVIVGPRQCGKSTLAEQVAGELGASEVTLDDAGRRAAANADPTGFIDQLELPAFIDEFQKAPALLPAIKRRVDSGRRGGRRAAGMFLLAGSTNVWATLRISESLAGRAERIQLWPLSQGEILERRERFIDGLLLGQVPRVTGAPIGRSAVSRAVVTGGYPEMLARDDARRRGRWARSYVDMVVERDVRDLAAQAQQLGELPHLLAAAAARVSGLLDTTELARDAKLKRDTASRYLTLLELLFLLRRTPAWSDNVGQRLIKAPKLHLTDSGLACRLVGYDERRFADERSPLSGALFENFIACELIKQAGFSDMDIDLLHYRTAAHSEVDLIIEGIDGALAGIEVKLGATVGERDFKGLRHLRDRVRERFQAGVVVHTGPETLPFGDRLWAVPARGIWAD
jgi:predicted AAA+ superfamily ATPase